MELLSPRTWATPAQASHTNSRVWVSPLEKIQDRWLVVKDNLSRVRFDRSPFVPQDRPGYFEHLASQAEDQAKKEKKRLQQLEAERGGNHSWIIPFDGQSFSDTRSAVLAVHTIWSLWYEPPQGRPDAPWPNPDEFREEGDERHTSGFGRFLPLPRVPGNETVVWKQKAFLQPFELDQVNPVAWRAATPRLLEEQEETLAETLMTEMREGNNDDEMNPDAGVSNPTFSSFDSETGEYGSTSARTENSQLDHQIASSMVRNIDGTPNPSPEPAANVRKYQATPRYNPASEFFPAADALAKRNMVSQLPSPEHSSIATPRALCGQDGVNGTELLCQKEANDTKSSQTGQLCSGLKRRVHRNLFDV
ncbi:hypothetical protein MMC34_006363 [Xylographa carneopallida]|nr:hypothetical protein [Xylographa carneopallida]